MNRKYFTGVAVVFIIIICVVLIQRSVFPTGYAVKTYISGTSPQDEVTIGRSDLKLCCMFVEDGAEKGCWVLSYYDCAFCGKYCPGKD